MGVYCGKSSPKRQQELGPQRHVMRPQIGQPRYRKSWNVTNSLVKARGLFLTFAQLLK